VFGSGFFQKLYAPSPAYGLMFCTSLEYHVLITVPLILLALSSAFFIPIALAAILASIGICITAALQADLPKKQRHFFSRPLIAALFFLQPIVRGWARYKTQLRLRLKPSREPASAEPQWALGADLPDQLCFWSKNGVDRYTFISRVLAKLDAADCQTALDSGWNDYDLELIRNRWTRLRLVTVNEYLANNRIFLRCRLIARWSILAHIIFIAVLVADALLVGYLASYQPWMWMLLLTLPIVGWFFDDERCHQHWVLAKHIQETASELQLEKYAPESSENKAIAPQPMPSPVTS